MGQALYRKYRSRGFDEVVGQEHIVKTLKSALKSGKISHAYLFTGPRGVGKTSVARILAHEVNGLEYKDETAHLDVIEIDAASNRRIDEIRDLRERVRVAPTTARFKVYIIDEVHMLTREAFNALLKTLEEPPAHVIFILATTEAHKLPETIVSRTQRFEFRPVSKVQAIKHLATIAKREKLEVSADALDLLAEFGNGSFRDSISYLDQLSSLGKKVTENDVRAILGLPTNKSIDELLRLTLNADVASLLELLGETHEQGISPVAIAAALSSRLRTIFLNGQIEVSQISLLKDLAMVSASSRPQESLEVALLSAISSRSQTAASPQEETPKIIGMPVKNKAEIVKQKNNAEFSLDEWDNVLAATRASAASLYTALRLAKPQYSMGTLTLFFQFPLHQKKMAQPGNQTLIEKIIKRVTQADVVVRSVLNEQPSHKPIEPAAPVSVSAINNIFGGAEVMEA